MYLLYCNAEGAVVGVHDDESVAVPMTAYPGVIRIIPWDEALSNLERFGEPPPEQPPISGEPLRSPVQDLRPYKQPDPTTAILKNYAAQVRFNRHAEGFQFNTAAGQVPIWTDRNSYVLIAGMCDYAEKLPTSTNMNYTQGGKAYRMTANEVKQLYQSFNERIQQGRAAEATCLNDLNSATPTVTTYEAVDQMFTSIIQAWTPPAYLDPGTAAAGKMAKTAPSRRPLLKLPVTRPVRARR